ncbi:unnamed protein product [Rhodiola kirilowii]
MAFGATEEPILARFDRIDNMLRQLEEIRTGSSCRTPKSSCASTPSSGTLTSEGRPSSDISPKSLEKYCRPMDDVIMEAEKKGTLIERLSHVEDKVVKICVQLEVELEAEKRSRTGDLTPTSSPRKKKSLKQLVRSCVRGNTDEVRHFHSSPALFIGFEFLTLKPGFDTFLVTEFQSGISRTMNTIIVSSTLPSSYVKSVPSRQPAAQVPLAASYYCPCFHQLRYPSLRATVSATNVSTPSNDGVVSVVDFQDFVEKDWSFLDTDNINTPVERHEKIGKIISAGEVQENSRVLVSIGAEDFLDRLVDTSPCDLLLVVHDSLFALALIKEKYDQVKCWQGELIYVPEKWTPFDVVFLYFLPGMPFELNHIFEALAARCLPGARVVISHPQGRAEAERQRQEYPDVVSDLPDKTTLLQASANHSFEVVEFVDDGSFYLAVLKYTK